MVALDARDVAGQHDLRPSIERRELVAEQPAASLCVLKITRQYVDVTGGGNPGGELPLLLLDLLQLGKERGAFGFLGNRWRLPLSDYGGDTSCSCWRRW
jgi:hypothetical protein